MNKVYTSQKNEVGYQFLCGCSEAKVGEETLVFVQYTNSPYGIALIKKDSPSGFGFEMVITEVFE